MEETESTDRHNSYEDDYLIDFITSSAISRISLKFLIVYIPILWFSGVITLVYWWTYQPKFELYHYVILFLYVPLHIMAMLTIFTLACVMFSKLILVIINLIHKPKQGIFYAEKGDHDFEFWCLRIEIKKLVIWLMNNWPLPYIDILAFRWFGIEIDFSSHLQDAWCDIEFVKFGRRVMVGQGAVVLSSMVIGKYLIIKQVILEDYAVIGGQTTIAPGTIFGKESLLGAMGCTIFNQIIEPGYVYLGVPAWKYKKNKPIQERREFLIKKDIDEEKKIEIAHEINIDEDKIDLI